MGNLKLKVFMVVLVCGLSAQSLFAGAWTLGKGRLWVKTTYLYQKTSDRYYSKITGCPAGFNCKSGDRVPFPFDGESTFKALFVDIQYGLLNRVDLLVQIPFYDISFTDTVNPERPGTSQFGDLRFGTKVRILMKPFVGSIKIQAKAPTGLFNKDTEIVPVGDGQWDLEFVGQIGKSLWPIKGYVNGDFGYRIRFARDVNTFEPGNEFFFRGEAGYTIYPKILVKAAINGLYGGKFHQGDFFFEDSERQYLSFEPGVAFSFIRHITLESSVQFSLSGKNFPAGQVIGFGVSYGF